MKKSLLIALLALGGSSMAVAADEPKECSPISAKVTQEVTAKPSDVLAIVNVQISANPTCACEIVKAAILAAKADKDLVGQIVFTAVTAAPTEATTVAECAVAVAPEASETIKSALKKAMSDDKNPAGDKNPGKNVVDKTPVKESEPDFGLSPVAIGGVYLVYPSGGATGPQLVKKNGKLGFYGPDGEFVPLNPPPPKPPTRPPGKPDVIVIIRPTPTGP